MGESVTRQLFWLSVLNRILQARITGTKGRREKEATEILHEEMLLRGIPDTGWYISWREFRPGSWWPDAIDPVGKRQDLRHLAGLL